IGKRQPSEDWHLLHLYNPRAGVPESVMPSYPWLFRANDSTLLTSDDNVVAVSEEFVNKHGKKIVATPAAIYLVAYLQSVKQPEMPGGDVSDISPALRKEREAAAAAGTRGGVDGAALYKQTCAACHQDNGKGVTGAFPPLAGSALVTADDPDMLIRV